LISIGSNPGDFDVPTGIELGLVNTAKRQNILVADRTREVIIVFDYKGFFLFEFTHSFPNNNPKILTVLPNGDIAVLDTTQTGTPHAFLFDSFGNFKYEFGTFGTGTGEFDDPSDIVSDGTRIFIADKTTFGVINQKILKYDPTILGVSNDLEYKIYGSAISSPDFTDKDSVEWVNLFSILDIENNPGNPYNHDFAKPFCYCKSFR